MPKPFGETASTDHCNRGYGAISDRFRDFGPFPASRQTDDWLADTRIAKNGYGAYVRRMRDTGVSKRLRDMVPMGWSTGDSSNRRLPAALFRLRLGNAL